MEPNSSEEEEENERHDLIHNDPSHVGHIVSSSGAGSSDYPPYHQMYMDLFSDLHCDYSSLHTTVQSVVTHIDSLATDFQGLNTRFGDFTTEYHIDRKRRDKRIEDIFGAFDEVHHWTRHFPGYQPPPCE